MPLCANNKVSRGGLHAQPAQTIAPLFAHVPPPTTEQAQAVVKAAAKVVDQAKDRVGTASLSQLKELLRATQRDVDKARRTPGAKRELRELESKFDKLKRDAKERQGVIDDEEHQDRLSRTAAIPASIDRLAPMNLGMGSGRTIVAAPVAARKRPSVPSQTSKATVVGLSEAETLALGASGRSTAELEQAKKNAQRALTSALKQEVPQDQVDRLKAAIKRLQQAEELSRTTALNEDEQLDPSELKADHVYRMNGYSWKTDNNGHVAHVEGNLRLSGGARHDKLQAEIGHRGTRADDGGHLIGTRFGGFGSGPNVIPQASGLNRWTLPGGAEENGAWLRMEDLWERHLLAGERVRVAINLAGPGFRPEAIIVKYWVDGELFERSFLNEDLAC